MDIDWADAGVLAGDPRHSRMSGSSSTTSTCVIGRVVRRREDRRWIASKPEPTQRVKE
jgi:hypothetical protein